ncbi:MAG: S41 family peptidase [Flavobacteriaceae bacterium]|nr:S41 family peptidase [Flavobacteriaceae bacterium]
MKKIKNKIIATLLIIAVTISFSYKSDFFEIAKQIEIYTTLFKELNLYYIDEINPAEVTERAINNVLQNLDPYTRFYDEQGVEDAKIKREGQYGGVGASIVYREGNLIVREIYKDNPAHKAGLLVGDKILKIDNTILKDQPEEVTRAMLKGLPNSTIKIQVKRQNQVLDFNLTRETIEINPVPFYGMVDEEVGYIYFMKFNKKASKKIKEAFLDLKSQGMTKLIIDVRHNPGGLLNEVIKIVNFFIPKGKVVVTTRAKLDKWSNTLKTKSQPIDTEISIAILIDNRSASASEILAGALQDYDRAVIIGERSFGKGLVQRSRKLTYGTQLKLTISKYYTPSGRCIQELDYTNRDQKTGKVPKFSNGEVNKFLTENGRTVYDGGGVTPDIEIKKPTQTAATKRLLTSDAFFNYITSYYYKNATISKPENFQLNEKEFNSLKEYLRNNAKDYQLSSEKALKKVIENIEKDKLNIKLQYNALLNQLQLEKLAALDENKEEILNHLTTKIINRYYFKEGEYQQKIKFDKTIKESIKILKNEKQYTAILN